MASFDPRNPLGSTVPYWNAAWRPVLATGDTTIFVADNMVYPIRRYTAAFELLDTVGRPPQSWVAARRPEPGEFAARRD